MAVRATDHTHKRPNPRLTQTWIGDRLRRDIDHFEFGSPVVRGGRPLPTQPHVFSGRRAHAKRAARRYLTETVNK